MHAKNWMQVEFCICQQCLKNAWLEADVLEVSMDSLFPQEAELPFRLAFKSVMEVGLKNMD